MFPKSLLILCLLSVSFLGQEDSPSPSFKVAAAADHIRALHLVVNPTQQPLTIDQYLEILCQLREVNIGPLLMQPKPQAKLEDYSSVVVQFYLTRSLPPEPRVVWEDPDLVAAIKWMPKAGLIAWVKGPVGIQPDYVRLACRDRERQSDKN